MVTLRPYQLEAVERIRAAYASGRRAPLFVLPTGGGKSLTFCFMAAEAAKRGRKVGIIVHRRELLDQASFALTSMGVDHGLISPAHPETDHKIQVASIQTLIRRLDRNWFNFLIIDEAHHATAGSWGRMRRAFPMAQILGVTATPCRGDGAGLGDVFDDLVIGPTMRELINQGHLVEPEVFAPPTELDLTGVKRSMGDFEKDELSGRVDRPKVTGSAVEHYCRLARGLSAIAFCVSRAHAEHVANDFRAAGIASGSIDGTLSTDVRAARILDFAQGRIQVLTSVDLVSEGFDLPAIQAAILLRPTYSTGLFLQQIGRALRPSPGKSRAIILDHVGNCLRHGLPDEDREWSLSPARSKRSAAGDEETPLAVRQCSHCYFAYRPQASCPKCGTETPVKIRTLKQTAGELTKLTKEKLAAIKKQKRFDQLHEEHQCKTLEDLISLGRARGYESPQGWAWHRWNTMRRRA